MSDAERLAGLVATWKDSIDDFVALLRSLPQDAADLPTDLPGWSVRDVASHTAHLEAVLAGGPEETIEVLPAEHLTSPMAYYTEQGVLARKGRTLVELADEIEQAAVIRYRDLTTNPPTDAEASTRKTPGDIGWTDGVPCTRSSGPRPSADSCHEGSSAASPRLSSRLQNASGSRRTFVIRTVWANR